MAKSETDTEVDTAEDRSDIEHRTSPELRQRDIDTAPDTVDTESAESLDEVHADAAYNRAVMGPAATDPAIATPGTEIPPEPGPGPEDNEALDNATGGALSNAAESGTAWPEPPQAENYGNRGELAAKQNIGIKTTFDMNAPGESAGNVGELNESVAGSGRGDGSFDPGEHTVTEVQDYLDAHPEDEQRVLAAEADGKNRSSIVG